MNLFKQGSYQLYSICHYPISSDPVWTYTMGALKIFAAFFNLDFLPLLGLVSACIKVSFLGVYIVGDL